jgi:subfamily B ATP-binding cassette protein MsbA
MPNGERKPRKRADLSSLRKAFGTIVWPRRGRLAVGLLLIFVSRVCGLVLPGSSRYLIDDVIGKGDVSLLPPLLFVVGVAVAVQSVSSFALIRLLSVEAQRLIADLSADLQAHVIHLPVRYFDRTQSGSVVSRVMSDVQGVRNLVGTGLVQLIGGIVTAAIAFVLLLRIDAGMTLIACVALIVFGLIAWKAFGFIRPIFRERAAIRAEVTGRLTEAVGGIRVIKGFHAEERERGIFRAGMERLFQNVKRTLTAQGLVTSSSTLLMGAVSLTIMGVGAAKIRAGTMTVGEIVAFTLYLGILIMPVAQMASIGTQLSEALAGLDRMEEVLSLSREGEEPERTIELADVRGEIAFEGVSFEYEPGQPVLTDVDLVAKPGTMTALVGSSGAGKTTLAGLAASFLSPTGGRVLVDGVDLAKVRLDSYRSRLGVVLQDDFLFEGTIRENLLFARTDASEEALRDAVAAAHVSEFADAFPDGLDTVIGERGVRLSGGQRQRVSIARAILADPRILILDEATSSLDVESEAFIQKSLAALMTGRTTFVIAHRLSTIRRADRILVLEDGRIVERGTHEELIDRGGRYHELYTVQARI